MKGGLQKKIDATALACRTCIHFRDDHLEYFYCMLQKEEFPALCKEYQYMFGLKGLLDQGH